MSASLTRILLKILYVEHDCNEKLSSRILEDATAELRLQNIFLIFTVVTNGFTALECFEHTKFDLLIIENALGEELTGWQLLGIIRSVGARTPAIALVPDLNDLPFPAIVGAGGYDAVLLQPFTTQSLLHRIISTLNLQISPINSLLSDLTLSTISSMMNATTSHIASENSNDKVNSDI